MGDHSYNYPEPLCYWVLLSPTLEFLYTSPAFKQVLGGYSESLIGQSFLDYLEPQVASVEEIKQASDHLLALDNDGERAQMITIRYTRLSAMSRLLSGQPIPHGPEHTYATFSFTISRAGNGILGFLHRRSDGITPDIECGTHPWDVLHSHDFANVQHFLAALDLSPPYHIFQVLKHNVNRDVIFTSSASIPGLLSFPTHHLAAATLHIGSAVKNQGQSGCMRRAKYITSVTATDGHNFNLTSVIIVLGSYLLVMHCLVPFPPNSPSRMLNHAQPWQENTPRAHRQVPNHIEHHTYAQPSRSYYPQNEPSHFHGYPPQSAPTWNPRPPSHSLPSPSVQSRSPYPIGPPDPHYMGTSPGIRSATSSQPHSGIGRKRSIIEEDPHEAVPRTRRKTDTGITAESAYKSVPTATDPPPAPGVVKQKAIKAPPPGVKYCVSCKTTDSPEWRKGPSGQKELCNACGLRWNRKQKKEVTAALSAGTELAPRKTKSEQDSAGTESRKSGSEGRHDRDSTPGTSRPNGRDRGEREKSGDRRTGSVASTSRSKSLSPSPSKTNSSDVDHKRRYELPPFSHLDKVVTDSALLVLSDYKPPQNRHPHNLHSYKGKQSRAATPSNSRPTLPPLFTAIPFETLPPLWDRLKNLQADEGGAVGPDLPPILNPAHVSTQELLGRSPQDSTCSGSSGPALSLPGMVERASHAPLVAP